MDTKCYPQLKEIYEKTRLDMLAMALTYIMDKGWSNIKEITDEEISSFEGNGLMTKRFVQDLTKLARDICNTVDNPTEIFQFCDSMGVYETVYFSDGEHLSRRTLEDISRKMANYLLYEDTPFSLDIDFETTSELADYLDIDEDELQSLLDERG